MSTPGPLSVELRLSNDLGDQYVIASDTVNTRGKWNDVYVNFGGYFGSYGPHMFAAAPDLLEALQVMVARIEHYTRMGELGQPNIEQWEYTEGSSDMAKARAAILKATGKQQCIEVQHPDDAAVDAFAKAMKGKLALARAKGRSGWQECDTGVLSGMLRDHVEKGDPRDVANFCMFLWTRGCGITPAKADLLEALKTITCMCESAGDFSNGVTDPTGTIDEGNVRASEVIQQARAAITKASEAA